ncbi:MAG TPA: ribonuclease III domain-containing protein, partial [Verrucomicrobiales bacterium]|nr:ribonuclease III domain-containing protein [Verrucomicrobiales bacterium]
GAKKDESKRREQELAWIGDTILDLFARTWILRERGTVCGETLRRMTSNQFLACIGNPTAVEAKIGILYRDEGMERAFSWIEAELLPIFEKQERNR